jgi:hypothetical protein
MCHIIQVFVCADINITDENPIKNNTLWISKHTGLDIIIILILILLLLITTTITTTTTTNGKTALYEPQPSLEDSVICHLWTLKNSNFFSEQGHQPCI